MSKPVDNSPTASLFTSKTYHDTYSFIKSLKSDLGERRVLISGASRGIGREMAKSFARAGYTHIALLARSTVTSTCVEAKKAAKSAGHREPHILELSADLTSAESISFAAKDVQDSFGGLDVLVNNAGYLETWKPIGESDPEDWWLSWTVNVKGSYLMDRAFIPLLLQGQAKTIITVVSAGAWTNLAGASAYQCSKLAQIKLNSYLNSEYGEKGLIAYAIHPGGVKTELASAMPEYMSSYLIDTPQLAADTVVWLTQERRTWLADRYLSVCWDMEEILARKDEIVSNGLLKINLKR